MILSSLLRRLSKFRPYDILQIESAETDNALSDHDVALCRNKLSNDGIRASQSRLLESVESMRATSAAAAPHDVLADLVREMRSSGPFKLLGE